MAEWSKALVLGTSHFDGVGSNPTAATNTFFFQQYFLFYNFFFYFARFVIEIRIFSFIVYFSQSD